MSEDTYDVVVLGAGPAGENAAGRAAGHGLSAVVVERELVGGECSYWGCIPSKALLRAGDVLAAARRVPGAREAVTGELDVAAVLARRDELISGLDDAGQVPWLEANRIDLVRGVGRLAGPRVVEVETAAGTQRFTARRAVVVATGSSAVVPPVEGLAEARPWDNRHVTTADHVPGRLLVVGGGAVGAEMAQAYRRLGAEVTLVEGGPHLLAREEPFAGEQVGAAFEAEGIRLLTGARLQRVHREADGEVVAHLADGTELRADEVLVAVGRRPRTDDIGVETVGLAPGRPIEVDDQLRATAVEGGWLYAVGDVNGLALLTHMGKHQARVAGDVIAGLDAHDRASRDVVTRVTFTDPQVCAVGLTEAQARERYPTVRTVRYGTGDVAGAAVSGVGLTGTAQLVVDEERRVVVGATITGPDVDGLLHSATVAVAGQVPLDALWQAVPAFPTVSEVWLRLLEAYGM